MRKSRIIAFYLPQYYPTDTNNEWYGQGFTEWTNVGKAKPLFRGHYQPKIPADLGYYDLRYPEIRELQANLARDAGIEGFCYYHYWFGDGKTELDFPLKEVMRLKMPNYPFCLCWANQSWYSKFWNNDALSVPKLIIEQKYNEKDYDDHFNHLLEVFKDKRYIKIDGKLLFMIYRPLEFNDINTFINRWRKLAKDNNICDFYFIGQATDDYQIQLMKNIDLDGINICRKDEFLNHWRYNNTIIKYWNKFRRLIGQAPYHYDYKNIRQYFVKENGAENYDNIYPTLIPNWDHSPRSGKKGIIFHNSTPEQFKIHMKDVLKVVEQKEEMHRIVFLKSWNEWGEGNYIEPDIKYGHGFLDVIKGLQNE